MDELCAVDRKYGYVITCPAAGSRYGAKLSDEARVKRSVAMKKACARPEERARKSVASKKNMSSQEARKRHSIVMKKIHATPEYKVKHSAACKSALARPEVKAAILADREERRRTTTMNKLFGIQ